ncbi:hypothetical protein HDU86_001920 [Geranomyces michiganensis]|nr:hypothetical protein HDU86_001920 [Geranomyces michiganensis]
MADGSTEDEPEVSLAQDGVVLAPANRDVNGRFLATTRSVPMADVFAQQVDLAVLLEANVAGRQRAPGYDKQRTLVTKWWTAYATGPLGFTADQVWTWPRDITGADLTRYISFLALAEKLLDDGTSAPVWSYSTLSYRLRLLLCLFVERAPRWRAMRDKDLIEDQILGHLVALRSLNKSFARKNRCDALGFEENRMMIFYGCQGIRTSVRQTTKMVLHRAILAQVLTHFAGLRPSSVALLDHYAPRSEEALKQQEARLTSVEGLDSLDSEAFKKAVGGEQDLTVGNWLFVTFALRGLFVKDWATALNDNDLRTREEVAEWPIYCQLSADGQFLTDKHAPTSRLNAAIKLLARAAGLDDRYISLKSNRRGFAQAGRSAARYIGNDVLTTDTGAIWTNGTNTKTASLDTPFARRASQAVTLATREDFEAAFRNDPELQALKSAPRPNFTKIRTRNGVLRNLANRQAQKAFWTKEQSTKDNERLPYPAPSTRSMRDFIEMAIQNMSTKHVVMTSGLNIGHL